MGIAFSHVYVDLYLLRQNIRNKETKYNIQKKNDIFENDSNELLNNRNKCCSCFG